MEDIVRGALAGIAIGGFVAAVFEANRIALQAVGHFNSLAMEMVWVMTQAAWAQIIREQQRRRMEAEYDADDEADDKD